MTNELAVLYAKRFIQRRDVKAVQFTSGTWAPDREIKNQQTQQSDPGRWGPLGFKMQHLEQHLAGSHTYGHYLLDDDSNCRMFAFDIDLEPEVINKTTGERIAGWYINLDDPWQDSENQRIIECDPRKEWSDRASPARPWIKTQMGMLARKLTNQIMSELDIPTAAAYSGSKGIHVYGFTGEMPASEVRKAALYVLQSTDDWELFRGQNFFRHKLRDPEMGYPNFSIEVFPKQDSLDGKDLGNLMRLPMGRNLKSPDPCFFLDLTSPIAVLSPHQDPIALLESGNPYA